MGNQRPERAEPLRRPPAGAEPCKPVTCDCCPCGEHLDARLTDHGFRALLRRMGLPEPPRSGAVVGAP